MFIAAALVVMAACNKVDTPATKSLSLNATVEQHEDVTKTYLDGTYVKWTANDEIAVFDNATTPKKAELKTTLGDVTSASFNVEVSKDDGFDDANASWAIYPYSATSSATTAGVITFTVDGTQNYVENSFDPEHNVMVGKVQDGNIAFKNAFGLLKLQLKGVMKVGKIELTGGNSEKLYGTFTANAASGYTAEYSTGGGSTITLDCTGVGGVQLDAETATAFYFVVPAGAFGDDSNGGFTATVYDIVDYVSGAWASPATADYNVDVTTSNKINVINRAKVRAMGAVGVTLLPASYTQVLNLESNGTQYIDTGMPFNSSWTIAFDVQWTALSQKALLGAKSDATWTNGSFLGMTYYGADVKVWYNRAATSGTGNSPTTFTPGTATKHSIVWTPNTGNLVLDGVTLTGNGNHQTTNTFTTSGNVFVYCMADHNGDPYNLDSVKLFYFRVCDSTGDTKLYYIPAKKGDQLGFYNVVNGDWVTNAGTGNFISGGDLTMEFHK